MGDGECELGLKGLEGLIDVGAALVGEGEVGGWLGTGRACAGEAIAIKSFLSLFAAQEEGYIGYEDFLAF